MRRRRKKRDYIQKKKDRFLQMSKDTDFDHQLVDAQAFVSQALQNCEYQVAIRRQKPAASRLLPKDRHLGADPRDFCADRDIKAI